jgi:hypothetical protein
MLNGRILGSVALPILLPCFALSQTEPSTNAAPPAAAAQPSDQAQQPPNYANFSIVLVNPSTGGTSVVLMHNPKNGLEIVPVNNT